jgi:hypothetical protein
MTQPERLSALSRQRAALQAALAQLDAAVQPLTLVLLPPEQRRRRRELLEYQLELIARQIERAERGNE